MSVYSVCKGGCCHSKAMGLSVGVFSPFLSGQPHASLNSAAHNAGGQHSSPPPNSTAEPKSACFLCAAQHSPPESKKKGLARRKHRLSILLLLIPWLASYGVQWPASLPLK